MKINSQIKEELKKYLKEREKKDAQKVHIVSAYPLTGDERELLNKKFPDLKDSEVSVSVDRDLIAGFVIRKGNKIVDLSLVSMIKNLQLMTHESA